MESKSQQVPWSHNFFYKFLDLRESPNFEYRCRKIRKIFPRSFPVLVFTFLFPSKLRLHNSCLIFVVRTSVIRPLLLFYKVTKINIFLVLDCFVWGSRNERKLFSFLKTVIGKLWLISRKMCFRNTINTVYFSRKHNPIELLSLKEIEFVKKWLQRIYIDNAWLNWLILTSIVPVDNDFKFSSEYFSDRNLCWTRSSLNISSPQIFVNPISGHIIDRIGWDTIFRSTFSPSLSFASSYFWQNKVPLQ